MSNPASITCESQPVPGGHVLVIGGEINFVNSPTLRTQVFRILDGRPDRLILNLSGVSLMDSSGIATLVEALRTQSSRQAKLIICGLQPRVRAMLEISRLHTIFKIVDDVAAAMAV